MSNREPALLLHDILESATKISDYTRGLTFEAFSKDSKTIDAVIRNFEIIGEAANKLPQEFKQCHPEVDWQRIRGLQSDCARLFRRRLPDCLECYRIIPSHRC